MDFTFLFLIILMLFAWQNNMPMVALAMFVAAIVSAAKSSSKLMLAGILVAAGIGVVFMLGLGTSTSLLVVGGLFVIFIITMASDNTPQQPPYGGGMY